MKTLYLHIGTPKTGTTAIQYFCAKNRDALEEKGLFFPDLKFRFPPTHPNRNGHFYICKIYDETKKRNPEEEVAVREEGVRRLLEAFETHDTVLLSDEGFWNHKAMNAKGWQEFANIWKEHGIQLKLIVYLRRQDAVVQSYWAQQIKERLQMSLADYIAKEKYTYFRLDYYEQLQMLSQIIGKENLIVRCYEKQQYLGEEHSLLSDFLHLFGLNLSDGFIAEDAHKNPSLSGNYLEAKRLLNANPDFRQKDHFIIKELLKLQKQDESMSETKANNYLSYDEAITFLQKYEESNRKTAQEFLQRRDGILFYERIDRENYQVNEIKMQKTIDICGLVIMNLYEEFQEFKKKSEADSHKDSPSTFRKGLHKMNQIWKKRIAIFF